MVSQALVAGILSSMFFIVLTVAMNIYMKWLFATEGGDFAFPWTMLAVQQLESYMVLQPVLAHLDPIHWGWGVQTGREVENPDDGKLHWFNLIQVLAVTLLFCLNVGLNSLSLVEISITLNQTVRAFLPVGVLILATCIEQRAYPSHSYYTTAILVAGIVLTCYGSPNFQVYGFSLVFISTLVAALGTSLNGRLLSKGPFSKSGPYGIARLLMIQSVPAFIIFGLIAAWTESQKLHVALFEPSRWTWGQRIALVSASSALALFSNLGRCFLVAATSALMETLAGNAKVAALCAIDHQLFGTQLFPANYVGIGLTCMGFSSHVLLMYASKETKHSEASAEFSGQEEEAEAHGSRRRASVQYRTTMTRPRLISAADTGLAAEHVAVQMGRPQKNRSESGDSSSSTLEKPRFRTGAPGAHPQLEQASVQMRRPSKNRSESGDSSLASSAPDSLRPRSVTWPAPRPQPEAAGWGVDMSLVLVAPSWLEPDRSGRHHRRCREDYSPLSGDGPSPAAWAGWSSAINGAPVSPARLAHVAGASPSARSRAHTDPAFQTTSRLLDDTSPASALMTVQEEEGQDDDETNGGVSINVGPLPPPDLPYL
mmetsp:Transcript_96036/g.277326  ORF Transcript_96036/g.277326 Transcript_96036/m.277326 type:complete len:598 (-) Transcript_96036:103-1896(-)